MSPASGSDVTETVGQVAPEIDVDLAGLLNAMAVGVWVCNATGTLVAINTAALHMVGAHSLEEVRGNQYLHRFANFHFEDGTPIPADRGPMARALTGENIVDAIEVSDDADGRKCVIRVKAATMRSASGAIIGAVKVGIDVTREYELAHAKDDFIRTAAHELKTPLAVIKANAETALAALEGVPGAASRSLEGLSRGIERVDRLINSLLDLLDIQGGLFSLLRAPVQLDELIRHAIARLPHRAAARVHVIDLVPTVVLGDEPRLRRAISSILDNAFKYSPRGTPVGVTLHRDGDLARLAIRDQGIGIPAEQQSRIFEKYFRAHVGTPHDAGGIGVGLFVAREILTQHGGRIRFESIENEGSTFFIELPIDRARQT